MFSVSLFCKNLKFLTITKCLSHHYKFANNLYAMQRCTYVGLWIVIEILVVVVSGSASSSRRNKIGKWRVKWTMNVHIGDALIFWIQASDSTFKSVSVYIKMSSEPVKPHVILGPRSGTAILCIMCNRHQD